MIADSSALIAILRQESDAAAFAEALEKASIRRISAGTYVETGLVIDGSRNPISSRAYDDLLVEGRFVIEPVTPTQARIAREAYRDFGKGSGHPAKLNFGDCFAYALAKELNEPLLFKGDDFKHTDVKVVPL